MNHVVPRSRALSLAATAALLIPAGWATAKGAGSRSKRGAGESKADAGLVVDAGAVDAGLLDAGAPPPVDAGPADAGPPNFGVLPFASGPNLKVMGMVLARGAATTIGEGAGNVVMSQQAVERALGPTAAAAVTACRLEAPCIHLQSNVLGLPRLLAAWLDRDEVHYRLAVVLIDGQSGKELGRAEREVLIASRQLESEFNAAVRDLMQGRSQALGTVLISATTQHVAITLDDQAAGEAPLLLELSPGRHELRAEKANHIPASRFIEVVAGRNDVEFALSLLPGRVDPDCLDGACVPARACKLIDGGCP